MLISDTIYYRGDGTVSSVVRTIRETFTKPSGAQATEDVESPVSLEALTEHLGGAYANMDSHNKALEAQIATEREAAASDKEALRAELQGQLDTLRTAVEEADAAWTERMAKVG